MGKTSIEWTDRTWNPTRGCSRVSEGCRNCYAERIAARGLLLSPVSLQGYASFTNTGPKWNGRVELIKSKLTEPLHWRKPQRIFVNSMSDLFHEMLSDGAIDRVFAVMALCPQHTFQVLTKRPERMLGYCSSVTFERLREWMNRSVDGGEHRPGAYSLVSLAHANKRGTEFEFRRCPKPPLPNLWIGVSVEDQKTADERIPLLLQTPAAKRFVSYEPALGPVDFKGWLIDEAYKRFFGVANIDWMIVGGESGPGARPFDIAWARNTIAQCNAAGVACFVKQLGSYWARKRNADPEQWTQVSGKGGDMSEWPEDLRVRDFPS